SGGLQVKNFDFTVGKFLTVGGFINNSPQRFSVNVGESMNSLSLHLDHRFNYGADQNTIVMNSTLKGDNGWETEQRSTNFTLSAGQYFEITLSYDINKFYIDILDGPNLEFPNRYSKEFLPFLSLAGDARLTLVKE
uniref:Congerin-1 n=1 Tax=Conger myriaster TaxID=7943 RepID=LEG1_CONMY|nr:RecName: Full=Congerin-1; AltName: Full=Beta-galactoside-binding lectin 1; AltName: Full=Congerin I [Conger myriaster]